MGEEFSSAWAVLEDFLGETTGNEPSWMCWRVLIGVPTSGAPIRSQREQSSEAWEVAISAVVGSGETSRCS